MIRNARKLTISIILLILTLTGAPASAVSAQEPSPAFKSRRLTAPLPLSAFPRPKNDNGMGIHWSTHLYGQEDEVTDYFVNEIKAMGIKWVKYLNDGTEGRHSDYLVQQLVANDIMPVARIYIGCNDPLDLGSLGRMVQHYLPRGVYYYELYNEPDIWGVDGGWCDDDKPDPEHLAGVWAPAAREILAQGGFPSLPSIFPVGKNVRSMDWRDSFFQQFLRAVKQNGDADILYGTWGAVHNYAINHPPDYPMDEVNLTGRALTSEEIARYSLDEHHAYSINKARAEQFEDHGYYLGNDPTLDVTGFLQFVAYQDQFEELFGFKIPLISTEGGATIGSCEDPRYPCVTEQIQMEWTLAYYEYMLDEAPEWYFANNTWLIAQRALDYFGGTVWESNAWYHDRKGDHIVVVDALKNHPRKGEARWDLRSDGVKPASVVNTKRFSTLSTQTDTINKLSAFGRLADYPRPVEDNGRGVHYAPTILAQPTNMVNFFIDELLAMNMKWVKIMQGDIPKIEHQYLVEELVAHDIEPIIRVYKPYNEPYEHLTGLVEAAVPLGVHYFELYNEPNINGFPGGWHSGEPISVDRILELWLPAAEAIHNAGGYPGLPTLATGGDYDDMKFLRDFLAKLAQRNRTDLLQRAWIPLHNYFLNHPFDYPTDSANIWGTRLDDAEIQRRGLTPEQVETINNARLNAKMPGGYYVGDTIHDDSNGFFKFDAYAKIFHDQFGFYIPIITTEGGPLVGDGQDPRYPLVTEDDHTELTLRAYHAMLDRAQAYYFAYAPWLMANGAGGHWDPAWEEAAWYKVDGSTLPVVDALKNDARRWEVRNWSYGELVSPKQTLEEPAELDFDALGFPIGKLETEIIPVAGDGPAWDVAAAQWKTAATPYPRLRINVLDEYGRQTTAQQIRVEWTGGWTLLITEPGKSHNATLPILAPSDMYVLRIAGGSGQGVRARGAPGYDLNVTFRLADQQSQ